MNQEQSKHFKYLLQQHREEQKGILEDMLQGAPEGYRALEDSELSRYDNHPAEVATELFDAEHLAALRKSHEFTVIEIEKALARIEEDRYGSCERCGKSINPKRLEILPYTRFCIRCAESEGYENALNKISKSGHRPVEEDVLEKEMPR